MNPANASGSRAVRVSVRSAPIRRAIAAAFARLGKPAVTCSTEELLAVDSVDYFVVLEIDSVTAAEPVLRHLHHAGGPGSGSRIVALAPRAVVEAVPVPSAWRIGAEPAVAALVPDDWPDAAAAIAEFVRRADHSTHTGAHGAT